MAAFRSLFALLALVAVRVSAQCVSYGIDYANGGQYYIDASSNQYFNFVTVFQGTQSHGQNQLLLSACLPVWWCPFLVDWTKTKKKLNGHGVGEDMTRMRKDEMRQALSLSGELTKFAEQGAKWRQSTRFSWTPITTNTRARRSIPSPAVTR
jgi:hypothetical protein